MEKIIGYLRWLWRFSRGIRLSLTINSLLGILSVCVSLYFIYICKKLVDIATRTVDGSLSLYTWLMIGALAVQLVISALSIHFGNTTSARMTNQIRYRIYSYLMESRWFGKEKMHTGDQLNRLEQDVNTVSDTICSSLPSCLVTGFQLLAAFLFLWNMDATLAWTLIFIMPCFLLFSKLFFRKMRRLTADIRSTDSRVQAHIQESLQHRTTLQSLEQVPRMETRLFSLQSVLYGQVMRRTRFSIFSRTVVGIAFSAGYTLAFLWGIYGIYKGTCTFGIMTAFLQLVGQVQRPTLQLTKQIPSFIYTTTSIDRLKELEASPLEEQGSVRKLNGVAGIRFEDVSFHYPDSTHNVTNHFSYNFKPGSRTAILGETGSGKSTLFRLILGLLQPQTGAISIYNTEGEKSYVSALTRCNFVYVPQGNTLFSGSIRDNLLLGKPDASEEEMERVLRIATADFVFDLPKGLNTICGEKGSGLSEGQAQRIAIARGLLRPGSILLLDEFSASIDSCTEQRLMNNLLSFDANKTMIFITHREEIADYCHQILKINRNL